MHEHEARLEKLEAERRDAPKAGRKLAIPTAALVGGAGPSRSGEIVVRIEDLAVGYLPGSWRHRRGRRGRDAGDGSSRGHRSWPPSAAIGSASSGRTGPARRRCCGRSPATCRRSMARSPSATRSRSATWPSSGARRSRGDRARRPDGGDPGHGRRGARRTSRGSCSAATTRSRRSGSCPAASGRGWSWPCSGSSRRTCSCSTSRPTTSTSRRARRSRRSWRTRRRRCWWSRTIGGCSRRCASRLWVVGDGSAVGFDGGYREWRAAVASGWTVATALELERARGRGAARRRRAPASLRRCA